MPRIQPVQKDQADAKTAVLLESVGKKLGMVPTLISTMAHSLAVANAYLGFSHRWLEDCCRLGCVSRSHW